MKLANEMVVPASIEEAWAVMLDVERVAPCLPGASIDSTDGDSYRGTMRIKLGPISSTFSGTLQIEEADEAGRRAVLRARARDSRGSGTASATITSTLAPAEEGTRVTVETDLSITGPAASFGRGVMQDVSARLMSQFADCVAAQMGRAEVGAPAEPAPAASKAGAGTAVPLAGPLPPDVPQPPATDAGVEWPAGRAPEPAPAAAKTPELAPATADVLDLGAVGRRAIARRLAPAAGAAGALLLAVAWVRRRQ